MFPNLIFFVTIQIAEKLSSECPTNQVITTLSQLEDLADSVADIGKCGVSPLITKHHLCATNTTSDLSMPPSDSNMDCLMEEGTLTQIVALNHAQGFSINYLHFYITFSFMVYRFLQQCRQLQNRNVQYSSCIY